MLSFYAVTDIFWMKYVLGKKKKSQVVPCFISLRKWKIQKCTANSNGLVLFARVPTNFWFCIRLLSDLRHTEPAVQVDVFQP